jgi:hypothetical protein
MSSWPSPDPRAARAGTVEIAVAHDGYTRSTDIGDEFPNEDGVRDLFRAMLGTRRKRSSNLMQSLGVP